MLKKTLNKPAVAAASLPAKKPLSKSIAPGTSVEPAPGAAATVATKLKIGQKVEPKELPELIVAIEEYDSAVSVAEEKFIALVEYIQENQVDKASVIGSLMKARGITYESAQTEFSKMKKIFNNEEVLADLKAGKITMKVAREKVKGETKKNPDKAKADNKEAKFTNTLKAFTSAAKESGFSLKEIIVSVTAQLSAAGIK